MDSITEFFAMGGYAVYIWPSYLLAATILGILLILSVRDLRRQETTLETLREQRRDEART